MKVKLLIAGILLITLISCADQRSGYTENPEGCFIFENNGQYLIMSDMNSPSKKSIKQNIFDVRKDLEKIGIMIDAKTTQHLLNLKPSKKTRLIHYPDTDTWMINNGTESKNPTTLLFVIVLIIALIIVLTFPEIKRVEEEKKKQKDELAALQKENNELRKSTVEKEKKLVIVPDDQPENEIYTNQGPTFGVHGGW